jgi:hypothetical protein
MLTGVIGELLSVFECLVFCRDWVTRKRLYTR